MRKEGGRGKVINEWERICRGTAFVQNTVARVTGSPGSVISWARYPMTGTGFEIDVSKVQV
jgi:hypothetical protein